MPAATALARAPHARPELAADAVRIALDKAGLDHPQAVLLFLSREFAHDPAPALTAAARTAQCLQIAGCTAAGVFTEEEWVLDGPAAAALVLGEPFRLLAADGLAPTLTLAATDALDWHWLAGGGPRYGVVAGEQGHQVWQAARLQASGRCELRFSGVQAHIGVSQGVRPLSAPQPLTGVHGGELLTLGRQSALSELTRALPLGVRAPQRLPLHHLMLGVLYGAPEHALEEGRYHLLPVLAVNPTRRSVTVAGSPRRGEHVFWALREPRAAEYEMRRIIERLTAEHLDEPRFALMFPCVGRGPAFYGGDERDIQQFVRHCPDTPLIGCYGYGEIAHLDGANHLLQYSTVLAVYYDEPFAAAAA
ncbi:MAG: FIST C-terminal domain-containing protein [Thiobacillaceae bacterium]|nr:FIST C-terminal domain-containing protein [Thiobacillaceae bacterium]MCX7673921.1 FIST C-terminal domain-containing protein [Thiobacillaceae bacterium]MDW8322465.1 FIST C-terminal domain-containing protein [Burkholderiales bacterium]